MPTDKERAEDRATARGLHALANACEHYGYLDYAEVLRGAASELERNPDTCEHLWTQWRDIGCDGVHDSGMFCDKCGVGWRKVHPS